MYVPAGSYKLFGGVKVPPGVELRGSFEGAHYGNATMRGTMLWAIGGKDKPDDAPLVTLSRGSGVRGITVYYPHQGWSDLPEVEDRIRVKKYPPTVRAAAQSWIRDCTFIGSWTAIDAMTAKCDGIAVPKGFEGGAALDFASALWCWLIYHLAVSLKWIGVVGAGLLAVGMCAVNRARIRKAVE